MGRALNTVLRPAVHSHLRIVQPHITGGDITRDLVGGLAHGIKIRLFTAFRTRSLAHGLEKKVFLKPLLADHTAHLIVSSYRRSWTSGMPGAQPSPCLPSDISGIHVLNIK